MEEKHKRKFKFYMTDDFDNEYESSFVIDDFDFNCDELNEITTLFKNFLRAVGYGDYSVDSIQCLEDEEIL